MQILGLASETHDTGLAILDNGEPALVLEEERLNRQKHTLLFPSRSLKAAFDGPHRKLADIDVITTPWDTKRLRRTFFGALFRKLPASLALSLPKAHTTQDSGVVFLNFWMRRDLRAAFPDQALPPIVNVGHHESHAAIYFLSPFEDATVIVLDGYGDDSASSVFTGQGNKLERRWHGPFFDSLGVVYTLMTLHLGFAPFEEGTVMALAACGDDRYVAKMRELIKLEPEGRFSIDMSYFSYDSMGMLRPFRRKFFDRFGPSRRRTDPLEDHHMALARALQAVTEDVVLHVARAARSRFPSRNLVFTGGVALNCVANGRLLHESGFERVWVPPCASDTGAPLGSALWHHHQTLGHPRRSEMHHAYLGLEYSDAEIKGSLEAAGLTFERLDEAALLSRAAEDLACNRIVGWYQGRYEIGPRALGNRSILASPLTPGIRDVINKRVKFREPFRPFAPSVLEDYAADYFELTHSDPFMTTATKVRPEKADSIPAAVHVDGTARVQTVSAKANPLYYALIDQFRKRTGVPILLNTSFNKQEPIVTRPQDAISCYLRTEIDVLVLGNYYCVDRPAVAVQRARDAFELIEANMSGGE